MFHPNEEIDEIHNHLLYATFANRFCVLVQTQMKNDEKQMVVWVCVSLLLSLLLFLCLSMLSMAKFVWRFSYSCLFFVTFHISLLLFNLLKIYMRSFISCVRVCFCVCAIVNVWGYLMQCEFGCHHFRSFLQHHANSSLYILLSHK